MEAIVSVISLRISTVPLYSFTLCALLVLFPLLLALHFAEYMHENLLKDEDAARGGIFQVECGRISLLS